MALQLATVIITSLLVANQFGMMQHPTLPTEVKVMATDSSLSEIYLDVPYIEATKSHANGPECIPDAGVAIEGILINEVIDILKNEYDICVKTTPAMPLGDHHSTPVTFTRNVGIGEAPAEAIATVNTPYYYPYWTYVRTVRSTGPGWGPYGCTTGLNPFQISLITADC